MNRDEREIIQALRYLLKQIDEYIAHGKCQLLPSDWILIGQITHWYRTRESVVVLKDSDI